jgi:hypothetical protein
MHYQREELTETLCKEISPLLVQHYQEIAWNGCPPLNPNFEEYIKADNAGFVRCYTARMSDDKRLIGYNVLWLKRHSHYQFSLQAVQDVIFMEPSQRGSGFEFMKYCDEELRKEGVQIVYRQVTEKKDYSRSLKVLSYEKIETVFARRFS